MSFMFDMRSLKSALVVPFKLVLASKSASESPRAPRPTLVQRWEKGGDGRLKGKWERDGRK